MDDILISQPFLRCYLQLNSCQQRCIFVFSVVIQTYLHLEASLLALSRYLKHSYGILKIVLWLLFIIWVTCVQFSLPCTAWYLFKLHNLVSLPWELNTGKPRVQWSHCGFPSSPKVPCGRVQSSLLSPAYVTTDLLLALKICLHFLEILHKKSYSLHSFASGLFPSSCDF